MLLWTLLVLSVTSLAVSIWSLAFASPAPPAKLFSTASFLFGAAALVQLEVSGFFGRLLDEYDDEAKYPYGPPSYINRELTTWPEPDSPLWRRFYESVLFDPRAGFWLGLAGLVTGFVGTWVG